MKKKIHLISSLIMLASLTANSADKAAPISEQYPPQSITEDVHIIHGPLAFPSAANQGFMNNPAIIETSAGLVVIDPGGTVQTGDMVVEEAKKISNQPIVATFSTHIHGDHWLGNQAILEHYPSAVLYAHPKTIELAENGEAQAWVDSMYQLTEGASAGTIGTIPNKPVDDGDEITIGDKTFRIVHKGQAHTITDIMIHVVEDDVYFLGDNTMNGRLGRMDDGSFIGLSETLKNAIATQAQHYVPGHGLTGGVALVESFMRLIDTVYATSAEEYDNGMSDFEIKPKVVERLQPYQQWQDFNEAIGKFVSLAVLEAENEAFK